MPDLHAKPATILALAVLLAAACGGETEPPGPSEPEGPARFSTSIEVSPLQPTAGARFLVTAGYAFESRSQVLGAYVTELRFDPAAVRFVGADPELSSGRVVNALGAESGSLVAAGASGEGFLDGLLFRGTFEALVPDLGPASFSLHVREAADTRLSDLVE